MARHPRHKKIVRQEIMKQPYDTPFTLRDIYEPIRERMVQPPSKVCVALLIKCARKDLNLSVIMRDNHDNVYIRHKEGEYAGNANAMD